MPNRIPSHPIFTLPRTKTTSTRPEPTSLCSELSSSATSSTHCERPRVLDPPAPYRARQRVMITATISVAHTADRLLMILPFLPFWPVPHQESPEAGEERCRPSQVPGWCSPPWSLTRPLRSLRLNHILHHTPMPTESPRPINLHRNRTRGKITLASPLRLIRLIRPIPQCLHWGNLIARVCSSRRKSHLGLVIPPRYPPSRSSIRQGSPTPPREVASPRQLPLPLRLLPASPASDCAVEPARLSGYCFPRSSRSATSRFLV